MARLVVASGSLSDQAFEVDGDLIIGREGADIQLEDSEVSRRHAVVRPAVGGIELEDLGSLNGTWVDGTRVVSVTEVANGGRVRVGHTTLRVESTAAATVAVAPAPVAAEPLSAAQPPPARERAGHDAFLAEAARPSSGVASRRWTPTLLSFGTVILTAIALVVYFAAR